MSATILSAVTMVLALAYLLNLLIEFGVTRSVEEMRLYGVPLVRVRLALTGLLIACYLADLLVNGNGLALLMIMLWALNGALAWWRLTSYQEAIRRKSPEPAAPAPENTTSPYVRIHEIDTEMSKLEAEKRELAKHPDAKRS